MKRHQHTNLEQMPAEDNWQQACESFSEDVAKTDIGSFFIGEHEDYRKRILEQDRFQFNEFVDCIFFLLEKAGVQFIDNVNDLDEHLRKIYYRKKQENESAQFYPDEIFMEAWWSRAGPGDGYASIAETYFSHSDNFGGILKLLTYWKFRHGDIVFLGPSRELGIMNWRRFTNYRMKYNLLLLKLERNKKYIPCIFRVAQDLLRTFIGGTVSE